MITYITADSTKTGVGRYAYDLYNLMKRESRIIQILFNKKYIDPAYPKPITGTGIYQFNYIFQKFVYSRAIKEINNSKDIIHITSHTIKPMFKSKTMAITIHDLIPFKPQFHDKNLISDIKNSGMRKDILQYTKFENIITVSNYVKNDLLNQFNLNNNRIKVISPYISNSFYFIENKENIRKEFNLPLDKKLILSVSSAEPRKNLAMVNKISEKISDEYQLVRVGPKVGTSITYNNLSIEQLNRLYNACDAFIFPTYEEGFGYPVLEAMKTGIPVVASNIEVMKENTNNAAVLTDPDDLEGNIEGIHKAIENKDYFIKKGFENVKKYSTEAIKEKLTKYYHQIKE